MGAAGFGARVSEVNIRPAPGEELSDGPVTPPRRAATVILRRDGTPGLEVLLVQRNPASRFMASAWVFPGGAVSRDDRQEESVLRAAAVRECEEEAGIRLGDPADLVPFSRWITPEEVKIRFDTWFFLAQTPAGQEARVDGGEIVDARWLTPRDALEAERRGELLLVFPTIKHLEQLEGFATAADLLEHARRHEIRPVQPKVVGSGETARVLLPGEPGYDS